MAFPFIKQPDAMDCGPACLCMVTKYYGKDYSLEYLRNKSFIGRDGVSLLGISKAAEMIGFHTVAGRITFDNFIRKSPFPCIVHWNQEHFVVMYGAKKKKGKYIIQIADPGKSLLTFSKEEFCDHWDSTRTNGEEKGIILLLEPTHLFYEQDGEGVPSEKRFRFLGKYLLKYKRFFGQLDDGCIVEVGTHEELTKTGGSITN